MANKESDTKKSGSGWLSAPALLKAAGIAGAAVGIASVARARHRRGKDFGSYTGWENVYEGGSQFFDRKSCAVEKPTYWVEGPTSRLDRRTEVILIRDAILGNLMKLPYFMLYGNPPPGGQPGWREEDGVESLPEPLGSFYQEYPKKLKADLHRLKVLMPKQAENRKLYDHRFTLAMAYAGAFQGTLPYPPEPDSPPEVWDYAGVRGKPLVFKSRDHASRLVKKMAHLFGATLVGITKLNPDWVWQHNVRGGLPGPYDVPAWWEYAIVIGNPMEWDAFHANPTFGTSFDAYSRTRIAAHRLSVFLRLLGYPARFHAPPASYDLCVPPIAIDAGLGQQGRHGVVITPELGPNFRPAVITTDLQMTVDSPIDFGVGRFCSKCKICAQKCPAGAISFADEPNEVVRGYRKWQINYEACFGFWATKVGVFGCRVCVAVCPYARKNDWVHSAARYASAHDPTGLADSALVWMQENLFGGPESREYYPPPMGANASYGPPPDWLQAGQWFEEPSG